MGYYRQAILRRILRQPLQLLLIRTSYLRNHIGLCLLNHRLLICSLHDIDKTVQRMMFCDNQSPATQKAYGGGHPCEWRHRALPPTYCMAIRRPMNEPTVIRVYMRRRASQECILYSTNVRINYTFDNVIIIPSRARGFGIFVLMHRTKALC